MGEEQALFMWEFSVCKERPCEELRGGEREGRLQMFSGSSTSFTSNISISLSCNCARITLHGYLFHLKCQIPCLKFSNQFKVIHTKLVIKNLLLNIPKCLPTFILGGRIDKIDHPIHHLPTAQRIAMQKCFSLLLYCWYSKNKIKFKKVISYSLIWVNGLRVSFFFYFIV